MKIIKASEFGLEENKANELTVGLNVTIEERKILIQEFETVKNLEITEENLYEFKELRLKIVKNRTKGINKWHKASKDYFLTGGRFVDAIRKKELQINESMETVLMNAEKHFENLEKERIEKLAKERHALLLPFMSEESIPENLGNMDAEMFKNYHGGVGLAYKTKLEAEAKAEAERLALIEKERLAKIEQEKERKRIEAENLKLKKEAEERERLADIERKKQADILETQRKEAQEKARIEAEKQAKIKAELKAKAEIERKEKERIEAELKEKAEKERLELEQKEKNAQKLLQRGDNEKYTDLLKELNSFKDKYTFESERYKTMFSSVKIDIDKIINNIS